MIPLLFGGLLRSTLYGAVRYCPLAQREQYVFGEEYRSAFVGRMSHLAWNFGSGPDDFYAATSFF
ncbi:MAG: hypothetical protein M3378_08710 [Actinomycetota bacterium]|nr:hypothetical protein [Actinomycetota bacterium]